MDLSLKSDIANQYSLAEATYKVAGYPLVITSVADSYKLLDKLTSEEFIKDEEMPYWAEIWPSCFVLSDYLIHTIGVHQKRCLELGAGVGVTSIALRKAGASVLTTDYSSESLPFVKINALQNQIELDRDFEVKQMDWRNVRLEEKFDIVCAADVLYERRNLLPIVLAIEKLLKPQGKAFIADPRREIAKGFIVLAEENGFSILTESRVMEFGNKKLEVDIYEIKRQLLA